MTTPNEPTRLDFEDKLSVEVWRSEIDGRIVVQVDTTEELGEDEAGEPCCRIYLNDALIHGVRHAADNTELHELGYYPEN